jgi:N-methylhydantoinase B
MSAAFDPAQVLVFNDLLASIAEEMGIALERSAFSPNIKERRDYSCAVFDAEGRLAAQAAHIPVHLGAMAALVRELRAQVDWEPDDAVACNDPYAAGTHLPDISVVSPVFRGGRMIGFVASRAHHADIGGATPGSMPIAQDLFAEGLRIPPVKLAARGRVSEDVMSLLCANSRSPEERRGDLRAQLAANRAGVAGVQGLAERLAAAGQDLQRRVSEAIAYTASLTASAIRSIPDGTYTFQDFLDSDGVTDEPVPIRVTVRVSGEAITFDFTGSAEQRPSGVNATRAVTESACLYVVRCLLETDAPTNEGCRAGVSIVAPTGTVVNATFPAAVAGGNVETSQRITDVVLGALARAIPEGIPAASQGTMNNLTFGGWDGEKGRPFAYYETIGGGGGAGPTGPGSSGLHCHMTNTRNTPVEALEYAMPLRVVEYRRVPGTGGRGLHRGGDGVRRTFRFDADVTGTLMADRRVGRPYGAVGGEPGKAGRDSACVSGRTRRLPAKGRFALPAGALLTVQTPGGGAWGSAQ